MTCVDTIDLPLVLAHSWHLKRRQAAPSLVYVQATVGGTKSKRSLILHRAILGAARGEQVDHRNGNTLDNRRRNLRLSTAEQNAQNKTLTKAQRRGGYKGVSWSPRASKWEAAIGAGERKPNGKRRKIYLGLFENPADAARAYDAAARKAFGEFASLNFPDSAEVA